MSDYFVGEVRMFAIKFAPHGWADCDGRLLPVRQNQALFSLYSTRYGGDGVNNFGIPDLRGRTPVAVGTTIPLAAMGGAEAVTLTQASLPVHLHTVTALSNPAAGTTTASPKDALITDIGADSSGTKPPFFNVNRTNPVSLNAATVGSTGGNGGHNNMQPFTVLRYCVALSGLYPSRG